MWGVDASGLLPAGRRRAQSGVVETFDELFQRDNLESAFGLGMQPACLFSNGSPRLEVDRIVFGITVPYHHCRLIVTQRNPVNLIFAMKVGMHTDLDLTIQVDYFPRTCTATARHPLRTAIMRIRCTGLRIFLLCLLVLIPAVSAFGQVRGSLGGGGRGAYGSGRSGPRGGLSGPRFGYGIRNNPIANPVPSLTPHQVFNPRGSLSPGQVLNPAPSLFRPRTNVSSPAFNRSSQFHRPAGRRPRSSYLNVAPGPTVTRDPVGGQVKKSAEALDQQLQRIAPKKGWQHYLALETLRSISPASDYPASENVVDELQPILSTFQSVTSNKQYAVITQLPEFNVLSSSLREYLTPVRDRQRQELLFYLELLKEELRTYPNGERWVGYFILPVETQPDTKDDQDPMSGKQLRNTLDRFEEIAKSPEYARVASLPAFQTAHSALVAFSELDTENDFKGGSTGTTSTP